MRIGQRLSLGFVAMAVLVGVIGSVSFIQIKKVGRAFERVEHETTPAIVALGEIKSNLFFLLLEVNEYVVDPTAEHLEEFGEAKVYLLNALSAYEKAESAEAEAEAVQALQEIAAEAITSSEELFQLKTAGAPEGVLLQKIEVLDDISESFSRRLNGIIALEGAELRQSGTNVRREIDRTVNATVVLTVSALFLALCLGIFLSRSISTPLVKLKVAAAKIGQGHLETKIQGESRDEIGELAASFVQMGQKLKRSRDDILSAKAYSDNIIGSLVDMLIVVGPDTKIARVNNATCELLGYQEAELIGSEVSNIYAEEVPIFKGAGLQKLIEKGALQEYAMTYKTKAGDSIPVSFSGSVMRGQDRNLVGIVGIARDMRETNRLRQRETALIAAEVTAEAERKRAGELSRFNERMQQANEQLKGEITERERAEEQIKASLKEKEVLLKEVHHRVKNNLQLISSLLNLQVGHERHDVRTMFQDSQHRVRAMAFIHEGLYSSDDLGRVPFAKYIRRLTGHLFQSYGVNPQRIALHTDMDPLTLGVDLAIPCGLMLNELVSNALKHAFPGGRKGEIRIVLHEDGAGRLVLRVGDNGIGIPPKVDVRQSTTLGLQLVTTLTEQVGGTLDVERRDGTVFTLTCPREANGTGRG